jgi:hypothetical protein
MAQGELKTTRTVSPAVAMAILVYCYGISSSAALVCVNRALEKEVGRD